MGRMFACVSLALLAAACGGDAGSGPLSTADAEDGCRRDCEHRIMCNPTSTQTVDQCTSECVADVVGWVRSDVFEAIVDCTTGLACSADDDVCQGECAPTDAHAAYEARCRAVFAGCLDPGELDGLCETTPAPGGGDVGLFCIATPAVMDDLTACIPEGTACQAGINCIEGVLVRYGVDL